MERCPECRGDDVIEWGDGYLCRDCGLEFTSHAVAVSDEE